MAIFSVIPVQFAVLLFAGAIAGVLYALGTRATDRAEARRTLQAVETYGTRSYQEFDDGSASPLDGSFISRIGGQLFSNAGEVGRRFTPAGYVDKVRHQFVMAGRDSTASVDLSLIHI